MTSTAIFQKQLAFGKVAESHIAKWLQNKYGYSILPVYDRHFTPEEENAGKKKGPQFYTAEGSYAAPDMLAMQGSKLCWIEAKCKTSFTWRRNSQCWQDGIDLHHYQQYCAIAKKVSWPIYLFFLHVNDWHPVACKDAPERSPTGLFTQTLDVLQRREHHRDMRHGRYGMVYWNKSALIHQATLDDIMQYQ